ALQMISWGLTVNDYGNAQLDENDNFIKLDNEGMSEKIWEKITAYADAHGLKKGDYKKLNLPFENHLLAQPIEVRERMARRVEDFIYNMLANVFNSKDTADFTIDAIIKAGSYDPGPKGTRIENPDQWTPEKIIERAAAIDSDKGPDGDFDD
ncbi:MAG: ketose-bisphosphate aldolase, partial [Desulfobacterales bacterium]|nr:ketose-bisphosphate aldolase [Desulfobacterales bacterium]